MHILRALRIKTLLLVLFLGGGGGGSVCFSREFLVGFFYVNLDAMFSLWTDSLVNFLFQWVVLAKSSSWIYNVASPLSQSCNAKFLQDNGPGNLKINHFVFKGSCHFFFYIIHVGIFSVCKMNIHKRCQKNVANNCGTNTRDMAQIFQQMGISGDKLRPKTKKVSAVWYHVRWQNKSTSLGFSSFIGCSFHHHSSSPELSNL